MVSVPGWSPEAPDRVRAEALPEWFRDEQGATHRIDPDIVPSPRRRCRRSLQIRHCRRNDTQIVCSDCRFLPSYDRIDRRLSSRGEPWPRRASLSNRSDPGNCWLESDCPPIAASSRTSDVADDTRDGACSPKGCSRRLPVARSNWAADNTLGDSSRQGHTSSSAHTSSDSSTPRHSVRPRGRIRFRIASAW